MTSRFLLEQLKKNPTLASVTQLVGHHPTNQKFLFLARAHASVVGSVPPFGVCMKGNQSMFLSCTDVSLPLFLPPFPSL